MLEVSATALPSPSTTLRWVVDGDSAAVPDRPRRGAGARRHPGFAFASGPGRVDERRAEREVGGVEEAVHRNDREVGVGDVALAVGVGEAHGLGDQVRRRGRARRRHVMAREQAENLQHRDAAGARRAHAANPVTAVDEAGGRALPRRVGGEVVGIEEAGVARRAGDRGGDVARDGALVEDAGAAGGDRTQRVREDRVAQEGSGRLGAAVGVQEIRRRVGEGRQVRHQPRELVQGADLWRSPCLRARSPARTGRATGAGRVRRERVRACAATPARRPTGRRRALRSSPARCRRA